MKLTKEKLWELKEMYESPFNDVRDIADKFNMDVQKLYNFAHRRGFVRGTLQEYGYQKCSICKKILEVNSNNFYKNKNYKNGFGYECKPCARKRRMKKYYMKKGEKNE